MVYSTAIDTQFSSGTKLILCPEPKELFVRIKDGVVNEIIKHGLSRTQSKLYFYFSQLDRFGDRFAKFDLASTLAATGIGKTAYYNAVAFFKDKGWFDFTDGEPQVSNNTTVTKKSANTELQSANTELQSANTELQSANTELQSANTESKTLKVLPAKDSATSQTLQTYSDLLQTLPEESRESFEKFCLKKIEELSFKIGSRKCWLNKHGVEYLEEFKEMYSTALANPQIMARKVEPSDLVDLPWIKRFYGSNWEDVARHHGLI